MLTVFVNGTLAKLHLMIQTRIHQSNEHQVEFD